MSVALNYAPSHTLPEGQPQFAAYALGKDYHDVVKGKLRQLAERLGFEEYRAFCDSAPVLERYWAVKAGLGWTGRNHQLIIPCAGSMFFLGELFLPVEILGKILMLHISFAGFVSPSPFVLSTENTVTLHYII